MARERMNESKLASAPLPAADAEDVHRLFDRAYDELRSLAHSKLRSVTPITALNTTSLVYECYLQLAKLDGFRSRDRVSGRGTMLGVEGDFRWIRAHDAYRTLRRQLPWNSSFAFKRDWPVEWLHPVRSRQSPGPRSPPVRRNWGCHERMERKSFDSFRRR
jgi:ECF sigma factor